MSGLTGWKIATALLFLCSIALAYRVFDQGITSTYSNASLESSSRDIQLLKGLIAHEWIGLPEADVVLRLKAYVASQPSDSFIVLKRESDEPNAIYLDNFKFEFRDGKLIAVK